MYQQVEDFLALGPVPKASKEMVCADIKHFEKSGGLVCVTVDWNGVQIVLIDFVPEATMGTAPISLVKISQEHRHKGNGKAIVKNRESSLRQNYQTHTIESGVQTNNKAAIGFWKRCGFEIGQKGKALDDGTVAYNMKQNMVQID